MSDIIDSPSTNGLLRHELPILSYSNLVIGPPAAGNGRNKHWVVLTFGGSTSWVVALTGIRGSGKSLVMAYLGANALAMGIKVWSNMNIAFKCKYPDGEIMSLASLPLDMSLVYNLEHELERGLVLIDELQYFADSRTSTSIRNRMLNAMFRQIRKRSLSFAFTTRSMSWLDKRLGWEVDLEGACWDNHRSNGRIKQGTSFHINWFDHSGAFTGHQWYKDMPPTFESNLTHGQMFWDVYDTKNIIDYLGETGPLKRVNTEFIERQERESVLVSDLVLDYQLQDKTFVPADEMRVILSRDYGLFLDARQVGRYLAGLGATRKRTSKGYFYDLREVNVT